MRTTVWARFVVVVVLAAMLSLPGRPELIMLGPPTLPDCAPGLLLVALVGAEALHMSCVRHEQVLPYGWKTDQQYAKRRPQVKLTWNL